MLKKGLWSLDLTLPSPENLITGLLLYGPHGFVCDKLALIWLTSFFYKIGLLSFSQ